MINQDRLIKTFLQLVKIDSPSGSEANVAREITKRLKALGLKVSQDQFGNVIGKWPGNSSNDEPIMLNAHLDTVEPGRGIKPQVDGGIIRSDGSTILGADPKAGVAAILEALTAIKERQKSHLPIEVVFTLGEEAGLQGAINLDYNQITAKRGVTFDNGEGVTNIMIAAPTRILIKMGLKPELKPSGGGTDVNIFHTHGIEAVAVGAGSHEEHTTREYLKIPEMLQAARFCEQLVIS